MIDPMIDRFLAAAALLVLAGCSRGPDLAPVRGKVTLAGKPLPPCEGRITFHPTKGRLATAALEPDGSFVLTTFTQGDGALVGEHKVTIKATKINAAAPASIDEEIAKANAKGPAISPKVQWIIPARYLEIETSPLTADVERKDNVIDFDVPLEN